MLLTVWMLAVAHAATCPWWNPCTAEDPRAAPLPVGHLDYCSEDEPCGLEEGDCDSDSDCSGELVCRHDHGEVYGFDDIIDVCVPEVLRCPEDYFPPWDRSDEVKLAFPLVQDAAETYVSVGSFNVYVDLDDSWWMSTHAWWAPTYPNHGGTDFMITPEGMEAGVPVVAAADGIVTHVDDTHPDQCGVGISWRGIGIQCDGPDPHSVENNAIYVCHPDGLRTSYLHVANGSAEVWEGDVVRCGETMAFAASAGNSAADHLHFGVSRQTDDPVAPDVLDPYYDDLWVDVGDAQFGVPSSTCD